jgi:hypothetical protein
MNLRACVVCAVVAANFGVIFAQSVERRAMVRGGGGGDRGKCTLEVVVDGSAEVEVRGDRAVLRNIDGRPPQWRRFECSAVMPPNPANFRFSGVDGRGRQQLVRDPRGGGPAVVRIDDPDSGSEGYTFDLTWSGVEGPGYGARPDDRRGRNDSGYDRDRDRDHDAYYRDRQDWFRRDDWRARLFERIRRDVEHVRSETFPGGGDQYRLGRTLQEIDELQAKLGRGRYDEEELDDVMRALREVVRDNRMSGRDREIMADDLERLRDFRARHNDYGAR